MRTTNASLIAALLLSFVLLPTVLFPGTAAAQWTQMDKQQEGAYLDVQLDFLIPLSQQTNDLWLRTELYGQLDFGDWGPYFSFPFTTAYPAAEDQESQSVAGQFEFGAFYQHALDEEWELFFRLGFSGQASSEAPDEAFINALGGFGRITDAVNHAPYDFALRASVSPELKMGQFIMRIDVGFDFTFADAMDTAPIFFRGNLALGVDMGLVSLALESANIGRINGDAEKISDRFAHTIGVNATFDTGAFEPYVGVAAPLQEDLLGEVIIVTAGVLFGSH